MATTNYCSPRSENLIFVEFFGHSGLLYITEQGRRDDKLDRNQIILPLGKREFCGANGLHVFFVGSLGPPMNLCDLMGTHVLLIMV